MKENENQSHLTPCDMAGLQVAIDNIAKAMKICDDPCRDSESKLMSIGWELSVAYELITKVQHHAR